MEISTSFFPATSLWVLVLAMQQSGKKKKKSCLLSFLCGHKVIRAWKWGEVKFKVPVVMGGIVESLLVAVNDGVATLWWGEIKQIP